MAVYIIRADYGRFTNQFKELDIAAIGWFNNHQTLPQSREEIEKIYEAEYSSLYVNGVSGKARR
jgi:hypothetical protein